MASPKFSVEAYAGRSIRAASSANTIAEAERIFDAYKTKHERVAIFKLDRIDQGVAVYDVLKTYDKGETDGR